MKKFICRNKIDRYTVLLYNEYNLIESFIKDLEQGRSFRKE